MSYFFVVIIRNSNNSGFCQCECFPVETRRVKDQAERPSKGFILHGGTEDGGELTNSMWYFENGKWKRVSY